MAAATRAFWRASSRTRASSFGRPPGLPDWPFANCRAGLPDWPFSNPTPPLLLRSCAESGQEVGRTQLGAEVPVTPGPGSQPVPHFKETPRAFVTPPPRRPTRFHGAARLDSARVGRDASRIAEEVVAHLTGLIGAEVNVTLEIEALAPEGVPRGQGAHRRGELPDPPVREQRVRGTIEEASTKAVRSDSRPDDRVVHQGMATRHTERQEEATERSGTREDGRHGYGTAQDRSQKRRQEVARGGGTMRDRTPPRRRDDHRHGRL